MVTGRTSVLVTCDKGAPHSAAKARGSRIWTPPEAIAPAALSSVLPALVALILPLLLPPLKGPPVLPAGGVLLLPWLLPPFLAVALELPAACSMLFFDEQHTKRAEGEVCLSFCPIQHELKGTLRLRCLPGVCRIFPPWSERKLTKT